MASTNALTIKDRTAISVKSISQATGVALSADDIVPDFDCVIEAILIEKNTAVQIDCDLLVTSDSITTTVRLFSAGAGVTSAVYLEDRHIPAPAGAILRFTSSLSATDAKNVTVMARRVDA